jgi:hypothetical protein
MTKTTWGISLLDRRLPDSTSYPGSEVTAIHWFAYQMAGKYTISTSGIVQLAPADSKKWTPYLSLNKETAMGWCMDALTSDRVKEIEQELAERVDAELHKASGLPWGTPDPLPPLPHPLGYVNPKLLA